MFLFTLGYLETGKESLGEKDRTWDTEWLGEIKGMWNHHGKKLYYNTPYHEIVW